MTGPFARYATTLWPHRKARQASADTQQQHRKRLAKKNAGAAPCFRRNEVASDRTLATSLDASNAGPASSRRKGAASPRLPLTTRSTAGSFVRDANAAGGAPEALSMTGWMVAPWFGRLHDRRHFCLCQPGQELGLSSVQQMWQAAALPVQWTVWRPAAPLAGSERMGPADGASAPKAEAEAGKSAGADG
eukprot:CAMPEP_0183581592 /NCGR_PEP_ID=MMETSP0371-20130417/148002_1 /TAXON_ID=268820 /ORGANISM="Peridinium aciculiferum, Strain PAER-2" /LENGTH=189 /DNA_ID=CAMNT_0025792275 /DNA_START=183 /DNA_END=750 /DNA_ORIENTATION=+